MRFPSRSCLLLLAAGLCFGAPATNVYQWKDAKGVTHSADKPPPGTKYDTRRIDTRGETGVSASTTPTPTVDPQCGTARQNLQLLGSGAPVMRDTDGDGKPDTALSDEDRAAQTALAEAAAKAYCPPAG
ncbi:DUF4124 domain-containing protein [Pseudoxanthomonas daejeonensis]|uniref:DUF4124 domain-containing protein n=1 Tax=Pseudoxanthomonas daejeonensis TaxID=266062 RepID=A0ABQ6ZAM7_9GAMM|nr:DUF4124 domain-containing protein [Pseudoxanthomonas daejeonensis]KAF1696927.1 DUF4124 domain-containing protein [Pseudoxanthomonas daejeonensis]UNK56476.1 DUF4124 domain-containing protein [Pseudoxanthomonas daejeonensis]